jgi:hypothetical protein
MKIEDLILSASKLQQPTAEVAAEFSQKRDMLALKINDIFTKRNDIVNLIGENNIPMMEDNHRNHARFLESVFTDYNPEVLVTTVLWVFRAYRTHGFHLSYWPAQLDTWVEIFKKELSKEAFAEIYPYYNWMIINQPAFANLSDVAIDMQFVPKH